MTISTPLSSSTPPITISFFLNLSSTQTNQFNYLISNTNDTYGHLVYDSTNKLLGNHNGTVFVAFTPNTPIIEDTPN